MSNPPLSYSYVDMSKKKKEKENYCLEVRNEKFRGKLEKKIIRGNKIERTTLSSSASTLEPCKVH
jgi:hypothetical protein